MESNEIIIDKINILFWKVWRNKYAISNILKFCSTDGKSKREFTYKNSEIFNVCWLIENNHLGLLFNKVRNGEPLTFGPSTSTSTTLSTSSTKNNNENNNENYYEDLPYFYFKFPNFQNSWVSKSTEFYSNLFKNYSNYFTFNKKCKDTTALIFVKLDIVIGLEVLVKEYFDCNNNNDIIQKYNELLPKSIYSGSLNVANFLYNQINGFGKLVRVSSRSSIMLSKPLINGLGNSLNNLSNVMKSSSLKPLNPNKVWKRVMELFKQQQKTTTTSSTIPFDMVDFV
ncbi:hypothetical protein DDB_G0290511 [Dictyostelium discoideum AX4]|uniref:Uncharacterized protein n=1 Tax=Dictyostelium discoideum TaxID=44689 RepID=Q54G00_DICDI|nr:hypothetical protein DDB_G0290511 [Dictyostelium discoideum AX4]EAL62116.1 hypothetical protein DDB_G0290511 [Dictyostelium discoideum AX4]|eukprot:XP_635617.1 hypothetical protein DDB_G0290511 [Dictyostelium discoideum AX4]